jgi:hypothetical protein
MGNSATHGIVLDDDDWDDADVAFRPSPMGSRQTPPRGFDNNGSPLPARTPNRSYSSSSKFSEASASSTTSTKTPPATRPQNDFFQGLIYDVSRVFEDSECSSSSGGQPYCAECITGACTGLDRRAERVEMRWSSAEKVREEIKSKERYANVPPISVDKNSLRQFMSPRLKGQFGAGTADNSEQNDEHQPMSDDVVLEV